MARKEGRIHAEVWEDSHFRTSLSRSAQGTWWFLIGQRDLSHAGVIPLRESRWIGSSSTTDAAELERDLTELEANRYIVIDRAAGEVLVRSLMRRDKVYRQPNVMLAAVDSIPLIASALIVTVLLAELERIEAEQLTIPQADSVAKMREALVKRLNQLGGPPPFRGSENPSDDPSSKSSDTPKRDLPGERGVLERVSTASPFPVPRSPDPSKPAAANASPPTRDSRTKRGSRIPPDYHPPESVLAWARTQTPLVDAQAHLGAFVDYWTSKPGKDGLKLDWDATYRNWLRLEQQKAARYPARASPMPEATGPALTLFNPDDHD